MVEHMRKLCRFIVILTIAGSGVYINYHLMFSLEAQSIIMIGHVTWATMTTQTLLSFFSFFPKINAVILLIGSCLNPKAKAFLSG